MGVAVSNGKDQQGNDREPTWFDVTVWNALAERCAEYLRKGRKVCVQGRMDRQTWQADDGSNRVKWVLVGFSVEFLSPRQDNDEEDVDQSRPPQVRRGARPAQPADYSDLDDLPF